MDYGLTTWNEHNGATSVEGACVVALKHETIESSFFWQLILNLCSGEYIFLTQNWDTTINCTVTCNVKWIAHDICWQYHEDNNYIASKLPVL